MTKIMTPSKTMTTQQINKAVANYRALLEKHAEQFDSAVVQKVLGQSELAGEQFSVFRRRVETISSLIVRKVRVCRSITPMQAVLSTRRYRVIEKYVVNRMPSTSCVNGALSDTDEDVEICFFKPALDGMHSLSDPDLEKEYATRGLRPVDPIALCAFNEEDPTFADNRPHGTHWKDHTDNWCFASFSSSRINGPSVNISFNSVGWSSYWWFAGVRV